MCNYFYVGKGGSCATLFEGGENDFFLKGQKRKLIVNKSSNFERAEKKCKALSVQFGRSLNSEEKNGVKTPF